MHIGSGLKQHQQSGGQKFILRITEPKSIWNRQFFPESKLQFPVSSFLTCLPLPNWNVSAQGSFLLYQNQRHCLLKSPISLLPFYCFLKGPIWLMSWYIENHGWWYAGLGAEKSEAFLESGWEAPSLHLLFLEAPTVMLMTHNGHYIRSIISIQHWVFC